MLGLERFFGSANERKLRPMFKRVAQINALEPKFQAMTDDQLRLQTPAFRERLAKGETLDDLLPEEVKHDNILLDPTKVTVDISSCGYTVEDLQRELFDRRADDGRTP